MLHLGTRGLTGWICHMVTMSGGGISMGGRGFHFIFTGFGTIECCSNRKQEAAGVRLVEEQKRRCLYR